MKKLLLSIAFLAFAYAEAQVNISFEESENYNLGQISGQNNWILLNASATNVMNPALANVSENRATDGTRSLYFSSNAANWSYFAGAMTPEIIGVANQYDVEYSFFPESNADSDHELMLLSTNSSNQFVILARVIFNFQGLIRLNTAGSTFVNIGEGYTPNQWYDIKFSVNGSNMTFFVNGVELGANPLLSEGDLKYVSFRYDNYGSGFNIDDISVTLPTASLPSLESLGIKMFPNPASEFVKISSPNVALNSAVITDLNGRLVNSVNLNGVNNHSLNVSDLAPGMYMIVLSTNNGSVTSKFIKN
jgi:hypothetical protein